MRILIFSDTHGDIKDPEAVINNIVGVEAVIHCGDCLRDAEILRDKFPKIKFYSVSGNCDIDRTSEELMLELGGKRIFVTHGHRYAVKIEKEFDYPTVTKKGKDMGADAVLFGHTHIAYNNNKGDIIVMNPGSIKSMATYGVIEIENGVMKSAIMSLV